MDTLTTSHATKSPQAQYALSARQPGMSRLIGLAVVVGLTMLLAIGEATDPDLWWHLATGRYILAEHSVLTTDVFSYTAVGQRWVTHEWLSDVLLYSGYRLIGHGGLALLFAVFVAAAFGLVYLRCRSRPLVAVWSVMLAASASMATWGVRPQMLTLLFTSIYLYILEQEIDAPTKKVWLLVPLTALWANLHSGFMTGLVLIGLFAVGQEWLWLRRRTPGDRWVAPMTWRLCLLAIACFAAACATPNGLAGAAFPFGTLSNGLIQDNIREWASVDFHKPWAWPLAVYWLSLLVVLGSSTRRVPVTRLLLLVGSGGGSLYSARHVPFLALVGAPVLADQLTGLLSGHRASKGTALRWARQANVCLALTVLALMAAVTVRGWRIWRGGIDLVEQRYPTAALAYMQKNGIGGRLYNAYHWGGYLLWHGYPVFIDGRTEVYGDAIFGDYLQVHDVKPGWEEVLSRYSVQGALIETDSRLAVLLSESESWQVVYRDETATLFLPVERPTSLAPGGLDGVSKSDVA